MPKILGVTWPMLDSSRPEHLVYDEGLMSD